MTEDRSTRRRRRWLQARGLLSSPESRTERASEDSRSFGGSEFLWHGAGCTCEGCIALGFACWCGDPHCENPEHEEPMTRPARGKEWT